MVIFYRKDQINSAKGYNKYVIFRESWKKDLDINLLAKKIVDHVQISLMPFTSIVSGFEESAEEEVQEKDILSMGILKQFSKLVALMYDLNQAKELYNTFVAKFVSKQSIFYNNDDLNISRESEMDASNTSFLGIDGMTTTLRQQISNLSNNQNNGNVKSNFFTEEDIQLSGDDLISNSE